MRMQNAVTVAQEVLPLSPNLLWLRRVARQGITVATDRFAPASFFGAFLVGNISRVYSLTTSIAAADSSSRLQLYGEVAHRGLVSLFLVLVVALYMVRPQPFRRSTGFRRSTIALGATVITTLNGMAPTTLSSPALSIMASGLIIAGMIIAIRALLTLKGCFSILPEARGLVTTGLYRSVRHPVYLGETTATLGLTLPVLSPITSAIFIIYMLLQWRRAKNEESVLGQTFPQYKEYTCHTKLIIPGIW